MQLQHTDCSPELGRRKLYVDFKDHVPRVDTEIQLVQLQERLRPEQLWTPREGIGAVKVHVKNVFNRVGNIPHPRLTLEVESLGDMFNLRQGRNVGSAYYNCNDDKCGEEGVRPQFFVLPLLPFLLFTVLVALSDCAPVQS